MNRVEHLILPHLHLLDWSITAAAILLGVGITARCLYSIRQRKQSSRL